MSLCVFFCAPLHPLAPKVSFTIKEASHFSPVFSSVETYFDTALHFIDGFLINNTIDLK
jgi:hypothetical protein